MIKFKTIFLIGIGFILILLCLCCLLNSNTPEWNVQVLGLPNIVERNPLTVQEGIQQAVILNEFE